MDTKEKIMFGMLDLIQEVGLEKASMGKLSQKIKISPGNIYFHFEGKQDLIDTLFEYCMLELSEYLDQGRLLEVDMDTDEETCREFVLDMVRRYVYFFKENPKMLHFVITTKSSSYLSEDIKRGRFKVKKPIYHFMKLMAERKIIKDIEVEYILIFMIGIMYELLKESVMYETMELSDEDVEKLAEIIWAALKYREPA